MIGVFSSSGHGNHGIYNGADDIASIRTRLFSIISESIKPHGEPIQIGAISDIHGHPSTGWPALPRKKTGCMSIFILGLLLAITGLAAYHTVSGFNLPISAKLLPDPGQFLKDNNKQYLATESAISLTE
jgi:hypothetical protein